MLRLFLADEKSLTYELEKAQTDGKTHIALKNVQGSHNLPISYNYKTGGNHHLRLKKSYQRVASLRSIMTIRAESKH